MERQVWSEVRNHLVVGEEPYLTLAETQYCVSSVSRFPFLQICPFPTANLFIYVPAVFLQFRLRLIFAAFFFISSSIDMKTQRAHSTHCP